jgi:hypothetical protein
MAVIGYPLQLLGRSLGVLCLAAAFLMPGAALVAAPAGQASVILDTDGTMWRYYEVWQTDVARLPSGELVRVDGLKPRERIENGQGDKKAVSYKLLPAKKVTGSAPPPETWRHVDFDDSAWPRRFGSLVTNYRSLSLMCLRGKFQVNDPAKAGDLKLNLTFRGGAVVYLNGKEIGRSAMPQGAVDGNTLADDYPKETFLNPDGSLLVQSDLQWTMFNAANIDRYTRDAQVKDRFRKRYRQSEIKIPAAALRPGVNVLAIEVHRAAAIPEMFTTVNETTQRTHTLNDFECNVRAQRWWNRVGVESLTLSAAGAGGVAPNAARPKGVQVWNHDVMDDVIFAEYGDPN